MRVLLLGILLILPAFSQPKVKQPCRGGVTTNCTPQAGADGSVPIGASFLDPVNGLMFGSALTSWGDSITFGTGASVPANSWVSLLASARHLTLTNNGVSAYMVGDAYRSMYAGTVAADTQSTIMFGANEQAVWGVNAAKQALFKAGHAAILAWAAIPNANKVLGQGAGVTYGGSWTTNYNASAAIGKNSTNQNDTATFTLYGRTIYVATVVWDPALSYGSGTFTLTVDGLAYGPYATSTAQTIITPATSANTVPSLVRIPNLPDGPHTVVLTITSAGARVEFDWAAGSGGVAGLTGPYVWASTITRQVAGYPVGGSEANMTSYNADVRANVRDLYGDGLPVFLADSAAFLTPTPTTYMTVDGIHPNDAGHTLIRDAFMAAMAPLYRRAQPLPVESVVTSLIPPADSATAVQIKRATDGSPVVTVDTINRRVGFGALPTFAKLEIYSGTTSETLASLATDGSQGWRWQSSGGGHNRIVMSGYDGTTETIHLDPAGSVYLKGGSANKGICWKADAKTLGYCSTVLAADGTCTCN